MKDKGANFNRPKGKGKSYSANNNIDNNSWIISGKSSALRKTVKFQISTQKTFLQAKKQFFKQKEVSHLSERTDFLPKEKITYTFLK